MYVGLVKTAAAPAAPQGLMRSIGNSVGRWWGNVTGRTVSNIERIAPDAANGRLMKRWGMAHPDIVRRANSAAGEAGASSSARSTASRTADSFERRGEAFMERQRRKPVHDGEAIGNFYDGRDMVRRNIDSRLLPVVRDRNGNSVRHVGADELMRRYEADVSMADEHARAVSDMWKARLGTGAAATAAVGVPWAVMSSGN